VLLLGHNDRACTSDKYFSSSITIRY